MNEGMKEWTSLRMSPPSRRMRQRDSTRLHDNAFAEVEDLLHPISGNERPSNLLLRVNAFNRQPMETVGVHALLQKLLLLKRFEPFETVKTRRESPL